MTYGAIHDRIVNEINRTDLSAEVNLAIKSAIAFYEGERFDWNEQETQRYTTDGTQYYGLPVNYMELDYLEIEYDSGITDEVLPKTYEELKAMSINSNWKSRPDYYAIYNDQLILYPIPNGQYLMTLSGQYKLDDLSATADTNAWVEVGKGEELIRLHSKIDLFINVIRGDAAKEAILLQPQLDRAYNKVIKEVTTRKATGQIQPTRF